MGKNWKKIKKISHPQKLQAYSLVDIRVQVRAYYNLRSVRSDFYVSVSKRKLQVSEISFQATIIKARKLFEGNLPI